MAVISASVQGGADGVIGSLRRVTASYSESCADRDGVALHPQTVKTCAARPTQAKLPVPAFFITAPSRAASSKRLEATARISLAQTEYGDDKAFGRSIFTTTSPSSMSLGQPKASAVHRTCVPRTK